MTQMIYRPQTEDIRFEGLVIHKTIFDKLPLDAIVIAEEDLEAFVKKGWFAHPKDMSVKNDDSKPSNRRKPKAS